MADPPRGQDSVWVYRRQKVLLSAIIGFLIANALMSDLQPTSKFQFSMLTKVFGVSLAEIGRIPI